MKKGFTLIELIFVIVIIGVLAAVAVPKFSDLRQNAEVNNVLKIVNDTMNSVPSAYINLVDLNGKDPKTLKMSDIVDVQGKGWTTAGTDATAAAGLTATYTDNSKVVATIKVAVDSTGTRSVTSTITCANFADAKSQTKCNTALTGQTNPQKIEF